MKFVHAAFAKNVTISLDEHLLEKCREFASSQGKSFNELLRDLLRTSAGAVTGAWDYADRLHVGLGPSSKSRGAKCPQTELSSTQKILL
jgi:hypothetical protein